LAEGADKQSAGEAIGHPDFWVALASRLSLIGLSQHRPAKRDCKRTRPVKALATLDEQWAARCKVLPPEQMSPARAILPVKIVATVHSTSATTSH